MRRYSYIHLDVFTDCLFGGNQLAVFTAATGLEASVMQAIAREMNFSESTFVFPPEVSGTDIRLRIFTPFDELPMAGHPTIGTAFALAHTGHIAAGRPSIVFGEGLGPILVELEWKKSKLDFAWMTQQLPQFGERLERAADAAAALALPPESLASGLPVEEVSCGVPFLFIPLASRELVDRARPEAGTLALLAKKAGGAAKDFFVFSTEDKGDGATAYSRMFAPEHGIWEDPATGAASGPLGAYLVRHGLVSRERARRIVSLQGVHMGRPSRIHIDIETDGGAFKRVRVGGRAVAAGEGALFV